jgi:uncharacterized protein YkwD
MNQLKFLSLLLALMAGCSTKHVTGIQNTKSNPSQNIDKNLILELVNNARSKGCQCGDTWYPKVQAVSWNNQLEYAAAEHSSDMYKKNYFSHNAPDGSNAGDRIKKSGYQWKQYGENIATGQSSEKQVVSGWLKSPGHCRNIMNRSFTEIGVGRSGNLWTMDLGSR